MRLPSEPLTSDDVARPRALPPAAAPSRPQRRRHARRACAAASASCERRHHRRRRRRRRSTPASIERLGELGVQRGRSVAQLAACRRARDAPSAAPGSAAAEHREGGAHRGRVGVVALVDQRRRSPPATRHGVARAAAPAARPARRARGRRRRRSPPTASTAASTASAFDHPMLGRAAPMREGRAGSPSSVGGDRAAGRARSRSRAARTSAPGMRAEADDARDAALAARPRRARSQCGLSRLRIAAPPGSSPWKISALASAIASTEAKKSEMRRLDRRDHRDMRADQPGQRGDLAGMVHADLEDAEARVRAACAPGDSGTPEWLL